MTRGLVAGLAWLLVVIGLPVGATVSADPPVPVDAGLTEAASLSYRYATGETIRYRVLLEQAVRVSDVTSSRTQSLRISGTLELALVVQRGVGEGETLVLAEEVREPSLEVESSGLDLSRRDLHRSLSGVARTLAISPRGRLVDQELQATDPAAVLGLLAFDFLRPGETVRFELPTGVLSIGDHWPIEDAFEGLGRTFDRRRALEASMVGWATVGGRRCAVLDLSGDAWLELPVGASVAGLTGPALARGVVKGYVYFDTEAGRIVRADVEVGTVGQATGATTARDFTEQASWTIELIE